MSAGVSEREIRRRLRKGHLAAAARGWYVVPADDPTEMHRRRVEATLRAYGGRVAASHQSALVGWGLPIFGGSLADVHVVTTAPDDRGRRGAHLVVHRPVPATALRRDPETGLMRCAAALAVVQHGIVHGLEAAVVSADAALRSGLVSRQELSDALTLTSRHPGSARVLRLTDRTDPRSESPGESRLRFIVTALGYAVTPQVWIPRCSVSARVDLLLDDEPVILEFDGQGKYGSRADLISEKRREDALRTAGYEVVRFVWADLAQPLAIDRAISAAILRARGRGGGWRADSRAATGRS